MLFFDLWLTTKRLVKENVILAFVIPVCAVLLFMFTIYSMFSKPTKIEHKPVITPPVSPYVGKIAGLGAVESSSRNIAIAPHLPGVITSIPVDVGQAVSPSDTLCVIDDRDAQARLLTAQATLEAAQIDCQNQGEQLQRYERVKDKRAISADALSQKNYAVKMAQAKIKTLEAEIAKIHTEIDRLHIKSPIPAKVLYIYKRPGEFAATSNTIMVVGNTDTLHVRVEFDETEALHIDPKAKAVGRLRGYAQQCIPLRFVRKEPLIKAKAQLTGDGTERFDTRVQEVVYAFDDQNAQAFVGQQMHVYVERAKP